MNPCWRCGDRVLPKRHGLCSRCRQQVNGRLSLDSASASALHAFGEAIATVARAQMIARVGSSEIATTHRNGHVYLFGFESDQTAVARMTYIADGGAIYSVLKSWSATTFDDFAAEAVAALIEECER